MRKEVKELYILLLHRGLTIQDIKTINSDTFEMKSDLVSLGCVDVPVNFTTEKAYHELLTFLYPGQHWQ